MPDMQTTTAFIEDLALLKAFAAFNAIWLGAVAGAATGMYIFSIPIIKDGSSFSSEIMLRQFHHLITRGTNYLQRGSRIQGVLLVVLAAMFYRHPDPDVARRWIYFASALVVGAQVAWYEVVFVFPINDTLVDMETELIRKKGAVKEAADEAVRSETLMLLSKWQRFHIGRIVIPLVAVTLTIYGLIF